MDEIAVYITNLWTFTWRYVGVSGARQNVGNETHLVQKEAIIQSSLHYLTEEDVPNKYMAIFITILAYIKRVESKHWPLLSKNIAN